MTPTADGGLLAQVRDIARAAGAAIMDIYASDFAVELKEDRSPLTAADKAAHELIVAALTALPVRLPVLSEESKAQGFSERRR